MFYFMSAFMYVIQFVNSALNRVGIPLQCPISLSILFDVTTKGRGVVSVDLGSSAWPLVDFDCNV